MEKLKSEKLEVVNTDLEVLKLKDSITKSIEEKKSELETNNSKKEFKEIVDQIFKKLEKLENKIWDKNELLKLQNQIKSINPNNIDEFISKYNVQIEQKKAEKNVISTIEDSDKDENPIARWIGKMMKMIWNA